MTYQNSLLVEGSIPASGTVSIFGYAGGNDTITAVSPRVYSETSSDENGYFSFTDILLDSQTKEICLSAIDKQSRLSHPTCIPVTPETTIGPVILSPTISLEYPSGNPTQVIITGQTIPSSAVTIVLSRTTKNNPVVIVRDVYAAAPEKTIKTDKYGYYSIKIPLQTGDKSRVFSRSLFQSSQTPPSSTLTINRQLITFFSLLLIIAAIALLLSILATKYIMRNKKRRLQNVAVQN